MDYREFSPPAHLRKLVKLGWTLSLAADPSATVRHVATPDGCMEIIRRIHGSSSWDTVQPERFVAGLITRPTELHLSGCCSFIGVRLWPWTWNRIGRPSCAGLLDVWAPLDAAAPDFAISSLDEAWAAFELLRFDEDMESLADCIVAARSVEELAARSGRAHRWLQRWFKREIGIPPRHYLRLLRFQEAFSDVQGDDQTLADHAAAHGYADQAHMAREFRAISGEPAGTARKKATGPFL